MTIPTIESCIPTKLEGRIDPSHLVEAATWAAVRLSLGESAVLGLTPGDGTVYYVVVARTAGQWGQRGGSPYLVGTQYGPMYHWHGRRLDESYVQEKWTTGHPHTARVLTAFLNLTARALTIIQTPEGPAVDPVAALGSYMAANQED